MQRQLYTALFIVLISNASWSHGPSPYRINGRPDTPNLFLNPDPSQLHNNHYYNRFNDNPSLSPPHRHRHESPYSTHALGSPYTPYSTPNPYGTYSNPYAPDLFNSPYDPSIPYNPGNIANPYGVYGHPYPISGQPLYNSPNSHGNFINNPYAPNAGSPSYGPYNNPFHQNWIYNQQMNRQLSR
ncbi:hypothetical protein [Candidatus Methylobacter oryzae]|uniref:Uncharacterized protein n=1 Tax=Candidatus Methylobacter oryzae TaxID=2497749 RepID=A0ABY3C8I8_9GAMM|nr:hypothetical protein [Candidatus Methylobacter oryzae]TRW92911.1 hypothetical protein EKO24_014235 [Candidatus Methylobacter oryzae]